MREIIASQLPLVASPLDHEHVRELAEIDRLLDAHPEFAQWVRDDLLRGRNPQTGRRGMSGELALRALVIKQMNGFSYEQLAFHLSDSNSYRTFCRLGLGEAPPKISALKLNLKRVHATTLEKIHRALLVEAKEAGVERANKVRFDCTVTKALIQEPSDSSLLWDAVRVLTRGMEEARSWMSVPFRNSSKRAKRRALGIQHAKTNVQRKRLYNDLLKVAGATIRSAEQIAAALDACEGLRPLEHARAVGLAATLRHYVVLARRVESPTVRRLWLDEQVPANEKIVSIFEPHTDVIIKDRREVLYGHKLCLATGASGLVLDCRIEDGNPADATLAIGMVERQQSIFGHMPRQVAFDGGFASKANLTRLKELGIKDIMFSKRRGLRIEDMVRSKGVYRRLRRFRAGIEAGISFLKRCFGLDRCTWRSLPSFKAYCWGSVVSANLLVLARHALH